MQWVQIILGTGFNETYTQNTIVGERTAHQNDQHISKTKLLKGRDFLLKF